MNPPPPPRHVRKARRRRGLMDQMWMVLKHLVFFGIILPLLILGGILFLATFGP